MPYVSPISPVSGGVISKATFGDVVKADLDDLNARVVLLGTIYRATATAYTPGTAFSDMASTTLTLPAGSYAIEATGGWDTSTGAVAIRYTTQIWDATNSVMIDEGFVSEANGTSPALRFHLFNTVTFAGITTVRLRSKVSTVSGAQFIQGVRIWARPVTTLA